MHGVNIAEYDIAIEWFTFSMNCYHDDNKTSHAGKKLNDHIKLDSLTGEKLCDTKPPHSAYAKTKTQISFAVTAKLISAFVFATRIVQFLYFLNPNFPVSSHLQCLYRSICVGPVRKPHCWFSHEAAQ